MNGRSLGNPGDRPPAHVSRRAVVRRLATFLAGTGGAQAVNLLTGLALIRLVPVSEYALYTIATVVLGIVSVTSDVGITSALVTFVAPHRGDSQRIGSLHTAALKQRKTLVVASAVVAVLLIPLATRSHGWSVAVVGMTIGLVILGSWVHANSALLAAVLNAHHEARPLATSDLTAALARIVLSVGVLFLVPSAIVAVAINVVALCIRWVFLRRAVRSLAELGAPARGEDENALKAFVKPLVPSTLYYAIQGQVSTLLLAALGTTLAVAQLGALTRVGQVFAVLTPLASFAIQPYFSRLKPNEVRVQAVRMLKWSGLALTVVVGFTASFPTIILWMVGPTYSGVPSARMIVGLVVASQCCALLSSYVYAVLMARRFSSYQGIHIAASVIVQVSYLLLFDVRSLNTAVGMIFAQNVAALLVQLSLLVLCLISSERVALGSANLT